MSIPSSLHPDSLLHVKGIVPDRYRRLVEAIERCVQMENLLSSLELRDCGADFEINEKCASFGSFNFLFEYSIELDDPRDIHFLTTLSVHEGEEIVGVHFGTGDHPTQLWWANLPIDTDGELMQETEFILALHDLTPTIFMRLNNSVGRIDVPVEFGIVLAAQLARVIVRYEGS